MVLFLQCSSPNIDITVSRLVSPSALFVVAIFANTLNQWTENNTLKNNLLQNMKCTRFYFISQVTDKLYQITLYRVHLT